MISEMLCFSSELLLVDSVGFTLGLSVFDFLLIVFLYIFNDINALKELKLKFKGNFIAMSVRQNMLLSYKF